MPAADQPSQSAPRANAGTLEYTVTILAIALGLLSCAVHAGLIRIDLRSYTTIQDPELAPELAPLWCDAENSVSM